jgi:hypothetical protein
MAATAANWTTVRLSSGICANILDFGIPQKHVLQGVLAMETGGVAGGAGVRTNQASRPSRDRPASESAPVRPDWKQGREAKGQEART